MANAAGLTVARMLPIVCRCGAPVRVEYDIQMWGADGVLWAEGTHESAEDVRRHVQCYRDSGRGSRA